MYKIITKNGSIVEYARFCGDKCEYVGFGTASFFDHDRAIAIAKMLRENGISCTITQETI
jgi:hypothetical protein